MASIKDTFTMVIRKAIENAELIESPRDKAMAYAAIASALAQTGRMGCAEDAAPEAKEPEQKAKKNSDKMKRQPDFMPPDDQEVLGGVRGGSVPKEEEKAPEKKTSEPKFTSEWTDEAEKYYEQELQYLMDFVERYGDDGFSECASEFSKGLFKDLDGVNPLNISALVVYLKEIEKAAEAEEEIAS